MSSAPFSLDAFIVLGARLNPQGRPGRIARMRLLHALEHWREEGCRAYLLLTGGLTGPHPVSEAQAMADFALAWVAEQWGEEWQELLTHRLILEEASRTTRESALNTLPLVCELNLTRVALVSDALHLRRAHYLFRRHFRSQSITLHRLPVPGVLKTYWRHRRYLWLTKMVLREGAAWLKALGRHALPRQRR